ELAKGRTERHCREEGQRWIFARVIAGRGPAGFDRSLGDRIEALQGRNECAGLEEFHFEFAAGHALEVFAEAHPRGPEMRERATEGALHLPADLVLGAGG